MKVGDMIRFKPTGIIGTIIEIRPMAADTDAWIDVKVLHNAEKVQNPTFFSMFELSRVAEVISDS